MFDRGVIFGRNYPGHVNSRRGHPHHPIHCLPEAVQPRRQARSLRRVFPTNPGGLPGITRSRDYPWGILTGAVTPTEAGIQAVAYCLFLSTGYYKTLSWKDLPELLWSTVLISCGAYLLVGMCAIFGWIMGAEGVPRMIANFILSLTANKVTILLLLNVVFLIAGCLIESIAAIILLVPIFLPRTKNLGVDPVHLGLVVCVNLSIGFAPLGRRQPVHSRRYHQALHRQDCPSGLSLYHRQHHHAVCADVYARPDACRGRREAPAAREASGAFACDDVVVSL